MKIFTEVLSALNKIGSNLEGLSSKLDWLDSYINEKTKIVSAQNGHLVVNTDGHYSVVGIDPQSFDCFTGQLIDTKGRNVIKVCVLSSSCEHIEVRYTLEQSIPKTISNGKSIRSDNALVITSDIAEQLIVTSE